MTQPPISKRDDTAYDEPDPEPESPADPANPGHYRLPGYTDPYGIALPIIPAPLTPADPPALPAIIAWAVMDHLGRMQALYQNKPPTHAFPQTWSIRPLTWLDATS